MKPMNPEIQSLCIQMKDMLSNLSKSGSVEFIIKFSSS